MLDPLDLVIARVSAVYADAEVALLRHLARRLARGLDDDSTWGRDRMLEVRAMRRDVAAVAKALAVDGSQAARDAITAAYATGLASAQEDLQAGVRLGAGRHSVALRVLASAMVEELRPVHAAILPAASTVYRDAVAAALGRRLATHLPLRQCAQAAWQALADRGVVRFTAGDGHQWRLHTYVEMAVRTAATRAATTATVEQCRISGHDLVYVADRPGECALCRPWEHRILSLGDRATGVADSTLDDAQRAGLHHPQCEHYIRPYRAGVTRLRRRTADVAGDRARVRLRYLERMVRHWREREASALTDEAATVASRKVAVWVQELEAHVAATGVRRKRHREHPGAGWEPPRSRAGDAVALA